MGLVWLLSFGLNHALSLRNLTSNGNLIGGTTDPTKINPLLAPLEAALGGHTDVARVLVGTAQCGVGEALDDLRPFNAEEFVAALFG